ncbi:hypothetical protein TDB9533_03240 [Thalassocella blandensis]|nr:hypothetical protein TDB9533_03240 [Thalassocella blandensis]
MYFALLGIAVGFLAGLLGIGGGTVMVPMLTSIFLSLGIQHDHVVHLALGTSMASIVLTAISSLVAHHKRGGVQWSIVQAMTPGILLGSISATLILGFLNSTVLAGVFALFLLFVAWQMVRGKKIQHSRTLPGTAGLFAVGGGIGALSTLVSIGGGSISVPFLLRHNVAITKAIGTSAALGFPIALFGACGYWVLGHFFSDSPQGFIYFPAVAAISLMSVLFAPLGVKAAYQLPIGILKKIFALLLVGLSLKMLVTIVLP